MAITLKVYEPSASPLYTLFQKGSLSVVQRVTAIVLCWKTWEYGSLAAPVIEGQPF
jgi:hypothetical protein